MNRTLGVLEQVLWLEAQTLPMNVVLGASVEGEINLNQISEAIEQVQSGHPLLGARIVKEENEPPRWVSQGVGPIPVQVLERQGANHWGRKVEAEMLRPFSLSEAPLLRLLVLHSPARSDLILTWSHCLGDGLGGAYLIRDILEAIGNPGSQQPSFPVRPPWEELIPPSKKQWTPEPIALEQVNQNRDKIANLLAENWTIRLLHWTHPSEETKALVARCRNQRTSVQGAICAAFLLAIAEMEPGETHRLKCLSPLSLRNYLTPPIGEDFGVYFTGTPTEHQIEDKRPFWNLAREVKQQLHSAIASGQIWALPSQLKAILAHQPDGLTVRTWVEESIGSNLTVTNLGNLNIPLQFGQLQLRQLRVSVTGLRQEPLIVGVMTLGGQMCVTLRYWESGMRSFNCHLLQQKARENLRRAIESNEF